MSAFGGEAVPKELQLTSIAIQTKDGGEVPTVPLKCNVTLARNFTSSKMTTR